ncbi:MAG: MATE family efflux transporter [Clostridia bacterium]|nr:MATE family efflux transporter [Clostridia bacterium]
MEEFKKSKMETVPMHKLIWKMGLPLIVSLVLQSVYNIVDTAFVINMGEDGIAGNLALTYAFPVQLLIIAIGVGTGVGVNALLSKKLGERDETGAAKTVGNGIFLAICIYAVFLVFGIFGCNWFISMQAGDNAQAAEMGTKYLKICCILSFGAIGFTVYERFLQSTGRTLFSTISQVSGAVTNIVLDYVFIYPCKMGVEGAAWATVAGQMVSLVLSMLFHYLTDKELKNSFKALKPSWTVIKGIFKIGISAAIMQGLLSVMMLGMTKILGTVKDNGTAALLQGSFGIYFKIMQFALFAAFGVSNAIISILSFNYGLKSKPRVKDCIRFGILDSVIVVTFIAVLFEGLASILAKLFGMASGESGGAIEEVVTVAIRISSIGYIFMAFSVAVQGVLQAFRYALFPLLISLLRLCVIVLPVAYLFTLSKDPVNLVWWSFPLTEFATAAASALILWYACKKKVRPMEDMPV